MEFPLQFTKLPLSLLSHAGEMVEHQGIAPCIPDWHTGVYLSTPMLGKQLEPPYVGCYVGLEIGIPCGNCTRLCGFANRRLG